MIQSKQKNAFELYLVQNKIDEALKIANDIYIYIPLMN